MLNNKFDPLPNSAISHDGKRPEPKSTHSFSESQKTRDFSIVKRKHCPRCQRPQSVCYCHTLSPMKNQWPVHILQHPKESKHAIGTAKIVQLSLKNCETHVVSDNITNVEFEHLIKEEQPLLVYPGKTSLPIQGIRRDNIRPLIFLDGSWRKTRRMIYEIPALQRLTPVSFAPSTVSRYRIRKTPNQHAVSTLEAIVTVLSELENSHEKYQPLLETMDWMIDKQIECMGKFVYEKNYFITT